VTLVGLEERGSDGGLKKSLSMGKRREHEAGAVQHSRMERGMKSETTPQWNIIEPKRTFFPPEKKGKETAGGSSEKGGVLCNVRKQIPIRWN